MDFPSFYIQFLGHDLVQPFKNPKPTPRDRLSPPELGFAAHLPVEVLVPAAGQADAPGPTAAELEGETANPTAHVCHFFKSVEMKKMKKMK